MIARLRPQTRFSHAIITRLIFNNWPFRRAINAHVTIALIKIPRAKVSPYVSLIKILTDDTHITSMKIVQFSRPPTYLVHLRPKFFHPLGIGRPISSEPPPSPNDNQSVKRKHNPRMKIILSGPSFRSVFVFSSLILSFFQLLFI